MASSRLLTSVPASRDAPCYETNLQFVNHNFFLGNSSEEPVAPHPIRSSFLSPSWAPLLADGSSMLYAPSNQLLGAHASCELCSPWNLAFRPTRMIHFGPL